MQHNNWNVFLQTMMASRKPYDQCRIALFKGTEPSIDPTTGKPSTDELATAFADNWLSTYETEVSYSVGVPQAVDPKQRLTVQTTLHDVIRYQLDVNRNDNYIATYLTATALVAQNPALPESDDVTPTWFLISHPSGNSSTGVSQATSSLRLMGRISVPQNLREGALLFLREAPALGTAARASVLSAIHLPF